MGWTFYTDPSRITGRAAEKAEIARICTQDNESIRQRPVHLSKVGSTWYVAVHSAPKPGCTLPQTSHVPDDDGAYVFAAIFLIRYSQGCFGYKAMDECMGPNAARAPAALLKKLSPLTDPAGYAATWRDRCRRFASIPKFNTGDVIRLGAAIKLSNGCQLTTLRQDSYHRRGRTYRFFHCVETGRQYRLCKAQLTGAVLVQAATPPPTQAPAQDPAPAVLEEFAARKAAASY